MPVDSTYLPLAGLLALVPTAWYLLVRPELGAALSLLSTVIIVSSLALMVSRAEEKGGKVFGTKRSS
ncbi:MAG: hypothetical protein ABEI31_10240 [Halodesulfurarchaeum sp.]